MKKRYLRVLLLSIFTMVIVGCGSLESTLLKQTDTVTMNGLTFEVPTIFNSNSTSSNISYIASYYYGMNSCGINANGMSSLIKYEGTEEEIKELLLKTVEDGSSTDYTYSSEKINGQIWGKLEIKDSRWDGDITYATINNGTVYRINYNYNIEDNSTLCQDALNIIVNSLSFK